LVLALVGEGVAGVRQEVVYVWYGDLNVPCRVVVGIPLFSVLPDEH